MQISSQEEELAAPDSFFSQHILERVQDKADDCEFATPLLQLSQLMHNEKMAADLLPYQEKLVRQVTDAIAH